MTTNFRFVVHTAERQTRELCVLVRGRWILPSEVLPTPGGPTKHRIGPFMLGFNRRTER